MRDDLTPINTNSDWVKKFKIDNLTTTYPTYKVEEPDFSHLTTAQERDKQFLDKINEQNAIIQSLKDDLETERIKNADSEHHISKKEWMMFFLGLGASIIVLMIEHWKDIYNFILSLI